MKNSVLLLYLSVGTFLCSLDSCTFSDFSLHSTNIIVTNDSSIPGKIEFPKYASYEKDYIIPMTEIPAHDKIVIKYKWILGSVNMGLGATEHSYHAKFALRVGNRKVESDFVPIGDQQGKKDTIQISEFILNNLYLSDELLDTVIDVVSSKEDKDFLLALFEPTPTHEVVTQCDLVNFPTLPTHAKTESYYGGISGRVSEIFQRNNLHRSYLATFVNEQMFGQRFTRNE